MSQSFDINTSYDALDETVYDIIDVDAYCSSLSPSVPDTESVPNTPTPAPRLKRYPKTRRHPRPSPAIIPPPVVPATPALASTSSVPAAAGTKPSKPDKGKGRQHSAVPTPSPVLWTPPRPLPPSPRSSLPQNSTSALCGCLSVSMSGSHRDGNQGSTNRIYGVWLKSSTPQKP